MSYDLKAFYDSVDELTTRDRAIAVQYGRVPDSMGGGLVPLNVDAQGHLLIGSGLTLNVTDITPVTCVQPNPALLNATVNIGQFGGTPVTIGQKLAAQSIPVVLASDQTITVGAITVGTLDVTVPPVIVTGSISSAGQTVVIELDGRQGLALQIAGTWSGVLNAQVSSDNAATWRQTSLLVVIPGGSPIESDDISGNNLYRINELDGITHVQVIAISMTSGTASITLTATAAPSHIDRSIISLDQSSPTVAGFSRLRVANPFALFDSQHTLDTQPLTWDSNLTLGGTAAWLPNEAAMLLTISSSAGSISQRRTKERFRYQAGKSQQILATGVLGTATANVLQKIGYYDNLNGVYFQLSSTGLSVVMRTSTSGSPVESVVPQSQWNVDSFDGTGPSGIAIDPTKSNIFFMELEWLGVGAVRMGFSVDGILYVCHVFENTNVIPSVYIGTGSLPITYEILATSNTAGGISMKQICTSVVSEGGQPLTPLFFTAGTGTTPTQVKADANYNIVLFRPSLTYQAFTNNAQFYPYAFDVITTGTVPVFVQAILNPTITGSPVWTPYNTGVSGAEYSITSGVTITGGMPVFSLYIQPGIAYHRDVPSTTFPLSVSGNGTVQNVVAFVGTGFSDISPVYGTVSWKEFH